MTRKKVKLAFITNDSARKATFKKRKKGLMKKVSELSTLCGIESCAIVYSPYEAQPDVWPDVRGAQRVLSQFKRLPEMEQSKKMATQESLLRQRMSKAAEQLKKVGKDNREKEITHLMYQCLAGKGLQGLGLPELNDMGWLIDQNLKEICKRIEGLKMAAPPPENTKPAEEKRSQQQWFTDWMENPSDNQLQMGGPFEHGDGAGGGDDMILPFNDGNNHAAAMWSNVFFQN
ncbi:hypothetical protein ACS0TY_003584 [Phlomoides rotata]